MFLVGDFAAEEWGTGDTCCDETYWNPVVGLLSCDLKSFSSADKLTSLSAILVYDPTNWTILNSTTAAVLL